MENQDLKSYKSNITKACIYKFLTNFKLFAGILIPFFTIWGGIKFSQVMILQAVFTFTIFVFEIPTGAVADKFGRKTSLTFGSFATMCAVILYSTYPNFWIFVFGEMLWGIGFSLISGADQAILFDSLKEIHKDAESKKIFGRWESFGIIALIIAPPLGSLIAKYLGLRYAMFMTCIPLFLSSIIAMTYKEPEIAHIKTDKKYRSTIKEGIKYFKGHKILQIIVLDYASVYILSLFIHFVYQVVLSKQNVSIAWFGVVFSLMTFCQILVLNNFSRLDKFCCGKKKYITISAVIVGISYVLMGSINSTVVAIIAIILIASFGLTRKTLFQSYMNKHIESDRRATVLSVVSMFLSLSLASFNIVFGYIIDWNLKIGLIIIGSMILIFTIISRLKEEHLLD